MRRIKAQVFLLLIAERRRLPLRTCRLAPPSPYVKKSARLALRALPSMSVGSASVAIPRPNTGEMALGLKFGSAAVPEQAASSGPGVTVAVCLRRLRSCQLQALFLTTCLFLYV